MAMERGAALFSIRLLLGSDPARYRPAPCIGIDDVYRLAR